jgi:hypothetical protein
MSTEIEKRNDCANIFRPSNLGEAIEMAKMLSRSGMVPKSYEGKPEAILVAVQMGNEIGLPPMAALQNIAVINGRPSIWGDAMLALVASHPDCCGVSETFDKASMTATCTVMRKGWADPIVRTFSVVDAKTARLWGRQGPWSDYPLRMLQQRARGFALRDAFPDALRGLISVEEAQDYQQLPSNNVKKAVFKTAPLNAKKEEKEETQTPIDIGDEPPPIECEFEPTIEEPACEGSKETSALELVMKEMSEANTIDDLKKASVKARDFSAEDKAFARAAYVAAKARIEGLGQSK